MIGFHTGKKKQKIKEGQGPWQACGASPPSGARADSLSQAQDVASCSNAPETQAGKATLLQTVRRSPCANEMKRNERAAYLQLLCGWWTYMSECVRERGLCSEAGTI